MKVNRILYLFPRNFRVSEHSKTGNVYYLVKGNTGEVLHYLVQKNDIYEDLKKSTKHRKRLNWNILTKVFEIKIINDNYEEWKEVRKKIHLWHERKKEIPELLVIVPRDLVSKGNGKQSQIFDLIIARTGEKIISCMCSEKDYAVYDLKQYLMDLTNEIWDKLGNRCIIKFLSDTDISLDEINRRIKRWSPKQISFRNRIDL